MKKPNAISRKPIVQWFFWRLPQDMRKHKLAAVIALLGIFGLGFFSPQLHTTLHLEVTTTNRAYAQVSFTAGQVQAMPKSEPVRLRIPGINVDVPFISLGLTAGGSLETPADGHTVGWYKNAPTPGEAGPAIVAGHVDTAKEGIGVFWNLRKLQPGDVFYIDRADGTTAAFRVDTTTQYPQNDFPTQAVYGDINYAGIRLITCGGTFSTATHHYSDNTVVYGTLIVE